MDFATQCIANIKAFHDGLPDTDIKFLFFLATDLSRPKVKTVFKRFVVDKQTFYVMEGIQNGKNSFHLYLYKESVLKYFVRVRPLLSASAEHDATILASGDDGEANHGDHVTFGITRQKVPDRALLYTHHTRHIDDCGDFNFRRDVAGCNVLVTPESKDDDLAAFGSLRCGRSPATTSDTMGSVYDAAHVHALYELSRIAHGVQSGGGAASAKRRYHVHKGRRYLVRRGKNCRYIESVASGKGKRVVIQRGGSYNGVTFMSDAFVAFLVDNIIRKVQTAMDCLEAASIFYDELDETCEGASEHIVMVYEYAQHRNVFYVRAHDALVACYVESAPVDAVVTSEERRTHDAFKRAVASVVQTVTVAT